MIEITLQDLKDLCPTTRRLTLARMVEPINETLPEFELTTTLRIAAFLAQTAHESMGFSRFSEIASGSLRQQYRAGEHGTCSDPDRAPAWINPRTVLEGARTHSDHRILQPPALRTGTGPGSGQ